MHFHKTCYCSQHSASSGCPRCTAPGWKLDHNRTLSSFWWHSRCPSHQCLDWTPRLHCVLSKVRWCDIRQAKASQGYFVTRKHKVKVRHFGSIKMIKRLIKDRSDMEHSGHIPGRCWGCSEMRRVAIKVHAIGSSLSHVSKFPSGWLKLFWYMRKWEKSF